MGGLRQARLCGGQPDLSIHVIGLSIEHGPVMWLRDLVDGRIGTISPLRDGHVDMFVSEERRCVGRLHDGIHVPCPDSNVVTRFRQCPSCNDSSIALQPCVFNPVCHGERCPDSSCSEPHIVYLGSVRSATKVGMTRESRMMARGREQGLDAMSVLVRSSDRLEAREAELRAARELSLPERIGAARFASALVERLDKDAVERTHRDVAMRLGMGPSETIWFAGYPMPDPLDTVPRPVPVVGQHRGRTVGVRGRYLVYGNRMLDIGAIPSHLVSLDRSTVRWMEQNGNMC